MRTLFLGHNYLDRKQKRIFSLFGICVFIFVFSAAYYQITREIESKNEIFQNSISGKVHSVSSKGEDIYFKVEDDNSIYYLNRNTSNNNYSLKYIGKHLKVGRFLAKESNSSIITIDDSLIFNINKIIKAK